MANVLDIAMMNQKQKPPDVVIEPCFEASNNSIYNLLMMQNVLCAYILSFVNKYASQCRRSVRSTRAYEVRASNVIAGAFVRSCCTYELLIVYGSAMWRGFRLRHRHHHDLHLND